jgi:hypothetical protein
MKANRRPAPPLVFFVALLAAFTASCAQNRIIPRPAAVPRPAPAPQIPAAPRPQPRSAPLDWQDAPITPGDWTWTMEGGRSTARFGAGILTLRCDRAAGTIVLQLADPAPRPQPITITTTSTVRTLSGVPQAGGVLAVTLAARDPLIDAMLFSRGRFAVETPGLAPLFVPSWPEPARVTEDCR